MTSQNTHWTTRCSQLWTPSTLKTNCSIMIQFGHSNSILIYASVYLLQATSVLLHWIEIHIGNLTPWQTSLSTSLSLPSLPSPPPLTISACLDCSFPSTTSGWWWCHCTDLLPCFYPLHMTTLTSWIDWQQLSVTKGPPPPVTMVTRACVWCIENRVTSWTKLLASVMLSVV